MAAACVLGALAVSDVAHAQDGGFALSRFQPAPAGDRFFSVAAPYAGGHLSPTAYLMFDYAHRPVRFGDIPVVSDQSVVRLDASLALWDRLLITVDAPLAVAQGGDDPGIPGTVFTELEAPRFGDVRIGARGRFVGENDGPFQLGLGGYFFAPSGEALQYTGDGAVRGSFSILAGGQVGDDVAFIYDVNAGLQLRAADAPHSFIYGAGAGVLLLDQVLQLGAELHGSTDLSGDLPLSSAPVTLASGGASAEVLGGVKVRVLDGLMFGAAAGPGIGSTVGTPIVRAMGTIGWSPLPDAGDTSDEPEVKNLDQDDDGIQDDIDACPDVPGEPSSDPTKDGCPPGDRDSDGVLDVDDACPNVTGVRSADVTSNGCPPDTDGDGLHDGIDACVDEIGDDSDDPTKRGCPQDTDGDAIVNRLDACPNEKGAPSDDPTANGCPDDPDGDGIRFGDDACPRDAGKPSDDPKKNGCPQYVSVNGHEILINKRIEFASGDDSVNQIVDPDSREVLEEVAASMKSRPNILLVEVQGHTDDDGTEEFNLRLSQRRAEVVRKWLIDQGGVDPDRLVAKGYGFNKPVADNRIRTGRKANRRVQFVILKKK